MKNILVILMIACLSQSSFAGKFDSEVKDFKDKAKHILMLLKSDYNTTLTNIDIFELELNIKTTKIKFTKRKVRDKYNHIKTAVNYPSEKLIKVNVKQWDSIAKDENISLPLILHEYLGLSHEEVDNYNKSRLIAEMNERYRKDEKIKKQKEEQDREKAWEEKQRKEIEETKRVAEEELKKKIELASLDVNKFEDRVKLVLSKKQQHVSIENVAILKIRDILFLYNSKFAWINEFENTSGAFWEGDNPMNEYRVRTSWDNEKQLINPLRDKICQDLGYSFSVYYGTSYYLIEHETKRTLSANLEDKEEQISLSDMRRIESINCIKIN